MKTFKLLYFIPEFLLFYTLKILQSNFHLAYIILSPKLDIQGEFIEFPIEIKSSAGLLLLSNLVSMTPGTLSADISDDKKILLIHALLTSNVQDTIEEIESIQKRILRLTN